MKRWISVAIALGLYLTLRGYHSRDGDQAYRLPLLLHAQDAAVFANDSFVRAFDLVNPHRGYIAILDVGSRVAGLSVTIFGLFSLTFIATCLAVDQLAKTTWPESRPRIGMVAVGLLLVAKAGNLGTNHLFEAMLLDRLVALALGWTAIAALVADPVQGRWRSALCVGLAGLVHPSLGVQIGMLLIAGQIAWMVLERAGESWRSVAMSAGLMVASLLPMWLLVGRDGSHLMNGLSPRDFLTLSASIQGPQHMLPHLWRVPQWLAGVGYLVIAGLAVRDGSPSRERSRVVGLLGLIVAALAVSTLMIEVIGSLRVTLFQPFRMATVARGLCLILIADRVLNLWRRGDIAGQLRAAILVAGLSGDWAFVAATVIELAATLGKRWGRRSELRLGVLAWGATTIFLHRNDTEAGHWVLAGACLLILVIRLLRRAISTTGSPARPIRVAIFGTLAWLVPVAAMIVPSLSTGPLADRLAAHCRFGEWPGDDVERLAAWCRIHTPTNARFIGPPGPKTFRLWSRREVAFNRSASPYHAVGLADWAARFRDHVGFSGTIEEFAMAYLKDRQALERGYDRMDAGELRALAERQEADYVLASSKLAPSDQLDQVRIEGRYAIYRVRSARPIRLARARPLSDPPARDNP